MCTNVTPKKTHNTNIAITFSCFIHQIASPIWCYNPLGDHSHFHRRQYVLEAYSAGHKRNESAKSIQLCCQPNRQLHTPNLSQNFIRLQNGTWYCLIILSQQQTEAILQLWWSHIYDHITNTTLSLHSPYSIVSEKKSWLYFYSH